MRPQPREVAQRLAAGPGSGVYGIPSVKVAYWGSAELAGRVPRSVFHPVPKVESELVRIVRAPEPATDADPGVLFGLVRQAFGQRRKTLRNTLRGLLDADEISAAGIDPGVRAETVDLAGFAALANRVAEGRV